MKDKIDLTQMANIVANESEIFHCSIEEAWKIISKDITNQFDFEEVKSLIVKLSSQT